MGDAGGLTGVAVENRGDRRARSFEGGSKPRDLGGNVIDAFAQERTFHSLVPRCGFGFLLYGCDLALQLAALILRLRELLLDGSLLGADGIGGGAVAVFRVGERGAKLRLNPLRPGR